VAELLTMKDIAQQLDIPQSNCRYYRDRFIEFIPTVKHGKRTLYQPGAVKVIEEIARLSAKRKSATEIRERLNSLFAVDIEVLNEAQRNKATTQQGETQAIQASEKANNKALAQANSEIFFLREIVKKQQEQIDNLTTKLLQLPAARPWYKRIFDRD
jgi:DNA-binding transcriptional MerR regulator